MASAFARTTRMRAKAPFSPSSSHAGPAASEQPKLYSTLETITVTSTDRARDVRQRRGASKRPIGRATANGSCSTATAACTASRPTAANRSPSTPVSPRASTTIMDSRPMEPCWPSATIRRTNNNRSIYIVPHRRRNAAAHHREVALVLAWLVAGRQDAGLRRTTQRRISTSTRFPPRAARKPA